ncbi:hypothetical protein A3F28_02785 [Candidatus Uhrbacteria bacterium RIFCSPHIGHO2_12_FULL_57_11]|uniref:Uncharacterized protein n=2 Tax=Candidatus Uhriibacteriota TaxID=1752732 RepID=A0A1F7UIP0_9BACT|nr:MAG: hypothetical protein A3D72_00325 [Candidatus Uhrbacteria bacterium RIFCSPHIGHO2_02_FULL_57_19]OGL77567.1 MAG: hypothetical protein A3F28_02785 [Candidatus Uhrbacteria bacterium RIFCSPHIGHO2_12_FULL_57_11]
MSKGGKSKSLRLAILEQMAVLAAGGFGLVAALAWNDAIQALFVEVFPKVSGLWAKFIYAIFVTVVVVLVSIRLGKMIDSIKKEL